MTQAGDSVCQFSIAVSRNTKDESGNRDTDFFDVVAWKKTAENCGKYLKTGRLKAIQDGNHRGAGGIPHTEAGRATAGRSAIPPGI